MKRLLLSFALTAMVCMIFSCKKKEEPEPNGNNNNNNNVYTCTTCAGSPEAVATEDNKSGGVYKGVVVGSSGTVKLVLANGSSTIFAVVNFDNTIDTLTTANLSSWTSGQGITSAVFTGKKVSLAFSVNADGSNPKVDSIFISGHDNVSASLIKETSDQLIKCYEGTFSGDNSGVWNLAIRNNQALGVFKDINGNTGAMTGSVNGTSISGNAGGDGTYTGTFKNDDYMEGTWKGETQTGTWTGKRTL